MCIHVPLSAWSILEAPFPSVGLRILITAPSNYGVGEVAVKLRQALPMPDGKLMWQYVVRIGRQNFNYGDLSEMSL